MLSAAISVSVNSANLANWREFTRDYCAGLMQKRGSLRARAVDAYLRCMGLVLGGLDMLELFL
jgi:hypothetical protein